MIDAVLSGAQTIGEKWKTPSKAEVVYAHPPIISSDKVMPLGTHDKKNKVVGNMLLYLCYVLHRCRLQLRASLCSILPALSTELAEWDALACRRNSLRCAHRTTQHEP